MVTIGAADYFGLVLTLPASIALAFVLYVILRRIS